MYVILSISADGKIEIHRVVEKLNQAQNVFQGIAYQNIDCTLENVSATQIKVYTKIPGYIYGNYKTLVKTIYLIPYLDIAPDAAYSNVLNELKYKQALRRSH